MVNKQEINKKQKTEKEDNVNLSNDELSPIELNQFPLKFKDLTVENQYDFLSKKPKYQQFYYLLTLNSNKRKEYNQYQEQVRATLNQLKTDFSESNVFEVKDFNLWYNNGKKQALFDINVNIKKGAVTSLIGPSGCGKSTFLKNLNRMNDYIDGLVTNGNIWFNQINIFSKKINPIELRSKVGMVFQKPNPFEMSIYDNVAFGPKNHGIRNKEKLNQIVEKALKDAALWDDVKDDLHTSLGTDLSGGQQQRLCIARTIALEPEVILMDEPTSALDPIATSKIENLILDLSSKVTIIIVTHSMAQAQRISDQTIFFYQGKVIESGPTKRIFTKPKEKLTKDYINGKIG